jgi:hypothetical protein
MMRGVWIDSAGGPALRRWPGRRAQNGFMLGGDSIGRQRVREAMSRYFRQKLWEALHELIGDGEINQRLTSGTANLILLQEEQIPREYLQRFQALIGKLRQESSTDSDRPREISVDEAKALAGEILDLFTEEMGGL